MLNQGDRNFLYQLLDNNDRYLSQILYFTNKLYKIFDDSVEIICVDNECKKYRSTRGCCQDCYRNNAHFSHARQLTLDLIFKRFKFNKETGFFVDGKGCILPREFRSCTCLNFVCDDLRRELQLRHGGDILGEIETIISMISRIRYETIFPT